MLCNQLMKAEPVRVLPEDTVQKAARLMRDEDIGFLPVCDAWGKPLGTLTDRDIVLRVVAEDLPGMTLVSAVMTTEIVACTPDEDVRVAEDLMRQTQKSRIMCIDGQGRLLGVISLADITDIESNEQIASTMRGVKRAESDAQSGQPSETEARPRHINAKWQRIFHRIEQSGALPVGLGAPEAAGAVCCVLSLRLSGGATRDTAANLPATMRELAKRCPEPLPDPLEAFGRADFTQALAEHLHVSQEHAQGLSQVVFAAVQAEMPRDEVAALDAQLTTDLMDLWGQKRRAA